MENKDGSELVLRMILNEVENINGHLVEIIEFLEKDDEELEEIHTCISNDECQEKLADLTINLIKKNWGKDGK